MGNSSINPDLQELHGLLVSQVSALVGRLGEASTTEEVKGIQNEITELNHRVTVVGNLLFTQQTAKVANAMDKVREAKKTIQAATKKIEDHTKFLKTMTSFLGLVDKVIDTAKLIA